MNINKFFLYLLLLVPTLAFAEDIPTPDKNAEGIKMVHGVIVQTSHVDSSHRGSTSSSGVPAADLVEAIFGTNYLGFPIYHVKINDDITLDVANRSSFKPGDCVLVWYDGAMGDGPDLSMAGQAGMEKITTCN